MEIKNNNLRLYRNKSAGDLIGKDNIYKNNFIPDERMEQYLNEYYNYFYSTKNSDKENININSNINNKIKLNNKLNSKTPIENIKKSNNNISTNIFSLPDDLLIEYNNRKRLDELRNKYLSNSSLHFLRKKDEINKNEEENKNKENLKLKKYDNDYNKLLNIETNFKYDMKKDIKLDEKIDLKEKQNNLENDINKNDNLENNNYFDLKIMFEQLRKEFNDIMEEKYNYSKYNKRREINIYKNYLIKENDDLKYINNKYEILLELLISYINDINKKIFDSKKIEYYNIKQNIWYRKPYCIDELSDFLDNCKKNIEDNLNKNKYDKIKIKEKKIINVKTNFNKKNSFSNYNTNLSREKNRNRYTSTTISFRNKFSNSSMESFDLNKTKTFNRNKTEKIKKPNRINLFKKKLKK